MKVEVLEHPEKFKKNSNEYMINRRFGKLVVLKRGKEQVFPNGRHRDTWVCKCDCGIEKTILGMSLRYGKTVSYGCNHHFGLHKTHGLSKSRMYKCWQDMKARCYNSKNKRYERYGGRGIIVCDEWLQKNGFINFQKWALENGYTNELTIDRIDINGNYEPNNCRWVSVKVQMNNISRNVRLLFNGKNLTYSEWEKETGIKQHTIAKRIRDGWSVKDALCIPLLKGGKKHGSENIRTSRR